MKTNKVLIVLVVLFSLIIIVGVVYIGYSNFFMQENKNANKEENMSNSSEELDINSGFVQGLYMYIENDGGCFNTTFEAREFELDASNIPYETKFIMALRIMLDADVYLMDCNKYEPTKYFSEKELTFGGECGTENYYDTTTNTFKNYNSSIPSAYTKVLREESLKTRMNQIFGPATYKQIDSVEYSSLVYKYLPEEQGYVTLSVQAGGTCIGHLNELTSAVKNDKEVILTVKKTTGENGDIIYNYEYTFTLNESDDSYYLTHISSKLA